MILLMFIMIAGMVIYSSFSWGFVLFKFWYWFLLPVFPALPAINYFAAIGLFMFTHLFRISVPPKTETDDSNKSSEFLSNLVLPWVTLLLGMLVHLFIG